MTYQISTTDGREWTDTYETRQQAAAAIAQAYGWESPVISESYAVGDGNQSAVSVYETQEECDADDEGAYAPRITGI